MARKPLSTAGKNGWWLPFAVVVILIAGIISTWWTVWQTDRLMRGALLQQASLLAKAVNIERIAMLEGTQADLKKTDFIRLTEQLTSAIQANERYRYIYILGRNPFGEVFFFVENETFDSESASLPGDIYEDASEELKALFDDGRPFVEGPLPDEWGVWVSALVPVFDPDTGTVLAVLGIDIDARSWNRDVAAEAALPVGLTIAVLILLGMGLTMVRSRQRLRESEERHRILFMNSPDAYLILEEGLITACNRAFETMFRGACSQVVGQGIPSISPPLQADGRPSDQVATEYMDEALQRGQVTFDWVHRRLDGSVFFVEVSLSKMLLEDRQVVFASCRDITERRQAEQEREMLQGQLLQIQKMESVGILAGGLAHDFNNLLQAMRGNIELLAKHESLDSQGATRLQTVIKALDRAAILVRQLLLFSRRVETRKMRVDVNQEVREAARMLERTIPKMIALELRLDPAIWPISGDPVQIEQVLFNLVNNAVDAMPEGGKLVIETGNVELDQDFVTEHPGSTAGRHIVLSASDSGSGMDETTRKHVFDPFFTTKMAGKGTGLGLASVYGIVKAHGGYIKCSSEPGAGTTFSVYLPAAKEGDVAITEPEPKLSPSLQGGTETILVVDDEPEIRELTQEALEGYGYSVLVAAGGEQALEIFRERAGEIDLVLLDLNMPGMGGHKCLHNLLQLDPQARVVIASGYSAKGQASDALTSRARGYIGKPYRLKDLAATVRKVLDEKMNGAQPE